MNCPRCANVVLVMSERQGIEIDYCPTCRGVWLDRGELDKILERSTQQAVPQASQGGPEPRAPREDDRVREPRAEPGARHDSHEHDRYYGKNYRRKSWLMEIFD